MFALGLIIGIIVGAFGLVAIVAVKLSKFRAWK